MTSSMEHLVTEPETVFASAASVWCVYGRGYAYRRLFSVELLRTSD